MKLRIAPFIQYGLSAAIVDTGKNWDSHHKDVMKTAAEVSSNGAIVGVS